MTNTNIIPVAPKPFYLQWHVTGNAGGQWNGSATSSSDKFYSLATWSMASGSHLYDLTFTVKQGQGNASYDKLFMMMVDKGTGIAYGARWVSGEPDPSITNLALVGPLALTAGALVSGDPRIRITSPTTSPSTSSWVYQASGTWLVNNEKWDGSTLGVPSNATVTVTDQTASSSSPHQCAMYQYRPGSSVGELYSYRPNPQTLSSSTQRATFGFTSSEENHEFSFNLFSEQPQSSSTS